MISLQNLFNMVLTEAHDGDDAGCVDYASPEIVAEQIARERVDGRDDDAETPTAEARR